MAIQITKMIFHGILNAILYIALPLILFEVISIMELMTFSLEFKISIIIYGIIGTVFAMLRHAYPKDTSANRLIAFGSTIYSGIYMFYFFGGFTPGVQLGTYYISTPTLQVLLGLQVIAWLLLGSSGIRALRYLVEAIELRKNKEYRVKFRLSKIFKVLGTILSLIIFGYLGSIVYSGMNLNFNPHDIQPTDVVWDHGVNPDPDYSDDTINITLTFDVTNNGIYALYNVNLSLELFTESTEFPVLLDEYTKIGEAPNRYFSAFHSFSQILDQTLTIVVNATYAGGLIVSDATLRFKISFETIYAALYIDLSISSIQQWVAPV